MSKRLINKSHSTNPYTSYFIRFSSTVTGVLEFKCTTGTNTEVAIEGRTNVVDGNWHNLVATYDGSNMNLYVDGSSDADAVAQTGAINVGTGILAIGAELVLGQSSPSNEYTGQISNVAIWNIALTAPQVREITINGI